MSFWVELHCDYRLPAANAMATHRCLSMAGDSPGYMAKTAAGLAGRLMDRARADGWKRTAKGWACPHCRKEIER